MSQNEKPSCPKKATYRRPRFLKMAALMPSAGTISIWKSTLVRITGAIGAGILHIPGAPGFAEQYLSRDFGKGTP